MTKQIKNKLNLVNKKVIVPFIDLILGRTISKKLTVFVIATIFAIKLILTGAEWVQVAQWYFMAQGAVDIVSVVKGVKK